MGDYMASDRGGITDEDLVLFMQGVHGHLAVRLARALAAERAAHRELRERLARLDALVAEGRGLVSFGVTENGDVGLFRGDDDEGLAYGDTVEDALMCWQEGARDGDK